METVAEKKQKKTAKILFISVIENGMKIFEEIGISYLTAFLREKGYDVELMSEGDKADINRIESLNPYMIGFPLYDNSKEKVYRIIKSIKEKLPNTLISVGGYAATFQGSKILEELEDIDFLVKGEGELPYWELLDALKAGAGLSHIKGLVYRSGGQIIDNGGEQFIKDINTLPWPARDLLEQNGYSSVLISSSRGCTGNCSFCVSKKFWKKWRGRNVSDVIDEVAYIQNRFHNDFFFFIDCSFEDPVTSYERVKEIAETILQRKLKIHYIVFLRAEFQRIADEALMTLLLESGLCGVLVGVEAANEDDLKLYHKRAALEDNTRAIELFQRYNLHCEIGFISFNPYSTYQSLYKNISFLEKYGLAYNMNYIASAYGMNSGCPLNQKIIDDGLLTERRDSRFNYSFVHKEINQLAEYIYNYIIPLHDKTGHVFMKLHEYTATFGYWKTIYKERDQKLYSIIKTADAQLNDLIGRLNSNNAAWFKELLELTKHWDLTVADKISETYLSETFVLQMGADFMNIKRKCHLKMERLGFDLNNAPFF